MREHEAERRARRLVLSAVFEADFGQRTAQRALNRRIEEEGASAAAARHARHLVEEVTGHRHEIDARIEALAPAWPVMQLARIDRALLRSAIGELLHCPTTPARVAISEWVELARTYSGEPARSLLNGVLGRIVATEDGLARSGRERFPPAVKSRRPENETKPSEEGSIGDGDDLRAPEEDRDGAARR